MFQDALVPGAALVHGGDRERRVVHVPDGDDGFQRIQARHFAPLSVFPTRSWTPGAGSGAAERRSGGDV